MKYIPNAVSRKAARAILHSKKHSPTILFVGGVAGVIGTTVLACKATLKLEDVLEDTNKNLMLAENLQHLDYTEEDRRSDKVKIYTKGAVQVVKLYAPAISMGVLSITMLTKSHNIMARRNAGLVAAYAALEKGYEEYRKRVADELGEEKEREFRYPLEACEIDDEDKPGKKKTVKKIKKDARFSIYARFFDDRSNSWSPQPEYNVAFLKCQQDWANDRLRARGHIFLNEIYDCLGLERSKEGAVVGWVSDGTGDDYVDFGCFRAEESMAFLDFVTGREGGIWLDFNVDGVIYDKI